MTLGNGLFSAGVTLTTLATVCQYVFYVLNSWSDGNLCRFGYWRLCLPTGTISAALALFLTPFGVGWRRVALPCVAFRLFFVLGVSDIDQVH